jgi:hypothetical protein
MSLNNGKGRVILKNQLLYRDTFCENLTAVKHANGRDWWIVSPRNSYNQKKHSNEYFIFLLDPNGITGPFIQPIGPAWESTDWGGQATFSPDGNKYARINPFSGLYLYDFNRCTGRFSSPLHFNFSNDSFVVSTGVCFSPNNQYLYALTTTKVYQFDISSSDILASKTIVTKYDGFIDGILPTYFFQAEIAPNGKIYATAPNSVKFLHSIEQPNLRGDSCKVEQHSLALKSYAGWEVPNFPHFRLGKLQGSTCDTLTNTANPQSDRTEIYKIQFNCFPNPVNEILNISFSKNLQQNLWIDIFDLFGHKVISKQIFQNIIEIKINVSNIPSGIYLLKLRDKIGNFKVEKLVKQ